MALEFYPVKIIFLFFFKYMLSRTTCHHERRILLSFAAYLSTVLIKLVYWLLSFPVLIRLKVPECATKEFQVFCDASSWFLVENNFLKFLSARGFIVRFGLAMVWMVYAEFM